MHTNGDFIHSSQNGTTPPDEARIVRTGGFVGSSHRDADRRASAQRHAVLGQRVKHYEAACTDLQTGLDAAVARRDGLPDHARGWPFAMYVVLAVIAVALEWVPASMFTQVFYQTGWLQTALTVTFTAIGVIVAIFLGELLRRERAPEGGHLVDTIFLAVVGFIAAGYLVIGYMLRVAYTTASANLTQAAAQRASGGADGALALSPSVEAIALTAVAAIGIVLTVVSTYHRESVESFGVHRRVRRLNNELASNQRYRNAHIADLDRVEKTKAAGAAP